MGGGAFGARPRSRQSSFLHGTVAKGAPFGTVAKRAPFGTVAIRAPFLWYGGEQSSLPLVRWRKELLSLVRWRKELLSFSTVAKSAVIFPFPALLPSPAPWLLAGAEARAAPQPQGR